MSLRPADRIKRREQIAQSKQDMVLKLKRERGLLEDETPITVDTTSREEPNINTVDLGKTSERGKKGGKRNSRNSRPKQ